MTQLAFEDLIHEHHDEIYRYLWRMNLGDREAEAIADDLAQETFLRAFRAYGRLRPDSNVRAWLYKIATNCARSRWRREQRSPIDQEADPLQAPMAVTRSPERSLVLDESWQEMVAALERLPPKQRAAVQLRYLQELSYSDVSEALDISMESARANVYQGLRKLRQWLGEQEEVQ